MDLLPCRLSDHLSFDPLVTGTQRALPSQKGVQVGSTSLSIYRSTFRAHLNRFFWLGYRLLHLGWAGLVWFSEEQSRCQQDPGHMGFLDAGVHAVSHGHLSADWTDLVQRVRQSRALIYGGPRLHGVWHSLVRDVLPAVYRFQRPARWMDGDSIPVSQHSWSRRFSACWRHSGNAYLCWPDVDL